MQQAVGAEVVGDVNFRQQVTVEISRSDRIAPAMRQFLGDHILLLVELDRRMLALCRAYKSEKSETTAVAGPRERVMQGFQLLGMLVDHSGPIGQVITDDQIKVPVTIQVGRNRR